VYLAKIGRNIDESKGNSYHLNSQNVEKLDDKPTYQKIAEQYNVSPKTVRNAEMFADAVNKVAENVGVSPQKILSKEALLERIEHPLAKATGCI